MLTPEEELIRHDYVMRFRPAARRELAVEVTALVVWVVVVAALVWMALS